MATPDDALDRVRWIGGGSAAGKSTVADRLATDHGLAVHHLDEEISTVAARLSASQAPLLHRFLAMDMNERWVTRSPGEMLETFHWFQGEGFALLIDDIRSRAADGPLVVEGFHLLPGLLAPMLTETRHAVWLLPTPGFRERVLRERVASNSGVHFVRRTNDPERALTNLLERDRRFTEQVRAEIDAIGLTAVDVDGSQNSAELAARVAKQFGLT